MTVEALAQTHQITASPVPPTSLQRYSLESPAAISLPANLLQPPRLESGESAASFRLEIDAARLLLAFAAAICATGPIIWVLVRYWLFAP